jgi:hypothetical protein
LEVLPCKLSEEGIERRVALSLAILKGGCQVNLLHRVCNC